MNRRDFTRALGLGGLAMATKLPAAVGDAPRPNIVFILADDMGWSDVGCYGGEIATPNLDRLGYNGVRFTQAHNTSKCFPSRACLLSGLYAQQCGFRSIGSFTNAVTLGEVLRGAGYRTCAVGKHHGRENLFDRGFDHYWGLRDGACNYFNPGFQREGEGKPAQKRYGKRVWCDDAETLQPFTPTEKDFYTTDYFGKYATKFLDEHGRDHASKPFFLYLAFNAPHDPLHAWPQDIDKYRSTYTCGFEPIRAARYKRQQQMGLIDKRWPLSPPTYKPWEAKTDDQKAEDALKMAVYGAMVDRMDQAIGGVLAKVREMGQEENTLVLFASDNGCSSEVVRLKDGTGPVGSMTRWTSLGGEWANVSNTPYRFYKNFSFEGGTCTPLIAHWPRGIRNPGRVSHHVCHFIDIMPTVAELAGATYPAEHAGQPVWPMEGRSLYPVLRDEGDFERGPVYFQWRNGKAVRDKRWKLVVEGKKSTWELYDMSVDMTETTDVAKAHPDVVDRLSTLYDAWWVKCAGKPAG